MHAINAFYQLLVEIFSYPFMVRAFAVGTAISICAALLGVSLILKNYAMIGNGLASVSFGATGLAVALSLSPFLVSLPLVLLFAFLLLQINAKGRGDSAIAILSTFAMAIGVMAIYLKKGLNTDICNYLFGTILGVKQSDVNLSYGLSFIVLVLFMLCYHRIFAITFDESFAKASGVRVTLYKALVSSCTALVVVMGMQMMGALLITSFIVLPAICAMRVCKTFRGVVVLSAIISVVCFWAGMLISYQYNTPTGASIVLVNGALLIVLEIFSRIKRMQFKKITASALALLLALSLSFSALATEISPAIETKATEKGVDLSNLLDIKEKMFLTQIYDIYFNFDAYKGRPVTLEGMYNTLGAILGGVEGENRKMIYRQSPGCCGNDGFDGFSFLYDGEMPKPNDWIRIWGVLKFGNEGEEETGIYIDAFAIEVLPNRGLEFVDQ